MKSERGGKSFGSASRLDGRGLDPCDIKEALLRPPFTPESRRELRFSHCRRRDREAPTQPDGIRPRLRARFPAKAGTSNRNAQPSAAPVEKQKRPRLIESRDARRTALPRKLLTPPYGLTCICAMPVGNATPVTFMSSRGSIADQWKLRFRRSDIAKWLDGLADRDTYERNAGTGSGYNPGVSPL